MLAVELNNNNIPQLQLHDTIAKGLQLVSDFKASHLPVVSEEKFLGLISEEDMINVHNKSMSIELLQSDFILASINENDHFLRAVNISNQYKTNVVPVTNFENELIGTITRQTLLRTLGYFSGAQEIGGIIVLEMERNQFTISDISRIVESNGATVLHLNTTIQPETGLLRVTIHINKKELSAVVAAFERYEYDVIYYFGEEKFENEIHSNYRHLMNYLDI
ncbi:MAG: CBS domain-containing protein [Chitinophagaceae bacterium]|jgi:predicted transcriptional regulator|nr:CBS domain-containing protein [Chitinophagaceae bacterium]